jgi:hypothetical protein
MCDELTESSSCGSEVGLNIAGPVEVSVVDHVICDDQIDLVERTGQRCSDPGQLIEVPTLKITFPTWGE